MHCCRCIALSPVPQQEQRCREECSQHPLLWAIATSLQDRWGVYHSATQKMHLRGFSVCASMGDSLWNMDGSCTSWRLKIQQSKNMCNTGNVSRCMPLECLIGAKLTILLWKVGVWLYYCSPLKRKSLEWFLPVLPARQSWKRIPFNRHHSSISSTTASALSGLTWKTLIKVKSNIILP